MDFGQRYLSRVYSAREQSPLDGMSEPGRAAYLAGRFAAKEAVYKALRFPRAHALPWTDIEVIRSEGGWPEVLLRGRAAAWAHETRVGSVEVSISHDGGTAIAVAVAHPVSSAEDETLHLESGHAGPDHDSQRNR